MMKRTKTEVSDSGIDTRGVRGLARGESDGAEGRLRVAKAYKMYVGGAFVRSESGRYFQVKDTDDGVDSADPGVVNVPLASRKDVRDAVLVAKNAQEKWAARTAYNRGQILYRLAEVMESRRSELVSSLVRSGEHESDARAEVDAAVDRAVFYAGFADKLSALLASHNPVSGPHFGFSVPEPMGVVGIVAPSRPVLLGLVSTILPAIVSGNTVVTLASAEDVRTAVVFTECLATSDLPGGVANVLTGTAKEVAPQLARHREVIALDVLSDDVDLRKAVEEESSGNVKRVKIGPVPEPSWILDPRTGQGLSFIEKFLETKTIWHPVGIGGGSSGGY
ncbi:MAG: aldehyde dehydrogenase family protein [Polyangiaceae bacterium]